MKGKQSYLFDFFILIGLSSIGGGLFLLYGSGVTALIVGIIIMSFGMIGYYKK